MNFNLKNLAFLIFIWAICNLLNGVLIFTHDTLGGTLGTQYYPIQGMIRLIIGLTSLIIFIYLWHNADNIIIFTKQTGKK